MKTKIIIADDHKIMREGLKALIEKQPDMEVAAEARDGLEVTKLARKLAPQVIIMDIGMENKDIKIIALSMHSDRRFVLEMLKAGASGYLLKDSAFEELVNAVHTVMTGQSYLSPRITDIVVKEYLYNLPKNESTVFTVLTVREREVLQLLAEALEPQRGIEHGMGRLGGKILRA